MLPEACAELTSASHSSGRAVGINGLVAKFAKIFAPSHRRRPEIHANLSRAHAVLGNLAAGVRPSGCDRLYATALCSLRAMAVRNSESLRVAFCSREGGWVMLDWGDPVVEEAFDKVCKFTPQRRIPQITGGGATG